MKTKGFALITLILIIGGVTIIGASVAFGATFFTKNKKIDSPLKESQSKADEDKTSINGNSGSSTSFISSPSPEPVGTSPKAASPSAQPSQYSQPQGVYILTLPGDWVVNSTFATSSYSTTKFTGPEGNVSITFGTGKDPAGGCSETSMVVLADRTIAGCFLLQKDGSRILTRAYTKDKAGLPLTIEAYINAPNKANQQAILDVIKTIDIR